jgi:hypothetical protein
MADKIFLEKGRQAYFVSRGESSEKAKRIIVIYPQRDIDFDDKRADFNEQYRIVSTNLYSDQRSLTGWLNLGQVPPLLRYAACKTGKAMANLAGLEFEDATNEENMFEEIDSEAENVAKGCLEALVKKDETEREAENPPADEGAGEDIPF